MSTTTEEPLLSVRPVETAPSATAAPEPSVARLVGGLGLFCLVLGTFAILAHQIFKTPRIIGEGWGFILAAFGLALMLYHAARDTDAEMRRLYGLFAGFVLMLALGAGLVPGPVFGNPVSTEMGSNIGWGIGFGLVGLLFLTMFARQETEAPYADVARWALLGIGVLLTVGAVLGGVARPNFLAGPGVALALLGLGFVCAYLGNVDTSDGLGYRVAFLLGLFGAVIAYAALGRMVFPEVLNEGPRGLQKPTGALDPWKVLFRVAGIAAFLAPAAVAYFRGARGWLLGVLGMAGVIGAGVLVVGSFTAPLTNPEPPFLIPGGVILTGLGLIFLVVSLGACSDNTFVTLTRRELGAYFLSPIGYLVLAGMAAAEWTGYLQFVSDLARLGPRGMPEATREPIVVSYMFALFPVLALTLEIPALTMRLLSEEQRTGSLEVLLTAPVSETTVVLSKFFATWVFFLVSWLPAGLFLIALRIEGGQPFDYRPLLSFYLALAACGAGFVSIGLFFSSLSRNQIVAAVLTFVAMLGFLLSYIAINQQYAAFGATFQVILRRVSYLHQWGEALGGLLPIRDVFVWLSLSVFCLFLTVKVLESRRWK